MYVAPGRNVRRQDVVKLGDIELEMFDGGSGQPLLFLHGGSGCAPTRRFLSALPVLPGDSAHRIRLRCIELADLARCDRRLCASPSRAHRRLSSRVVLSVIDWRMAAAEVATKTRRIDRLVGVRPQWASRSVRPTGSTSRTSSPCPAGPVERLLYVEPEQMAARSGQADRRGIAAIARNRQTLALVTGSRTCTIPSSSIGSTGSTGRRWSSAARCDGLVSAD